MVSNRVTSFIVYASFQFGTCRSVREFEKLNRIGEGTYGIVCEL